VERNEVVVLVDANNMVYRTFNLIELSYQEERTEVAFLSLRQLMFILKTFHPSEVVFVWDGGYDKRRLRIFPKYKSDRQKDYDEEQLRDFAAQRSRMQAMLFKLGVPQVKVKGREADDVIGVLAKKLLGPSGSIIIVSTDRDYFQLISKNVFVYSPTKNKLYDETTVMNELGVKPSAYPLWKAIVGGHDGIPGLHRVGPKGAQFLISHLEKGIPPQNKREETVLNRFHENHNQIEVCTQVAKLLPIPEDEIWDGLRVCNVESLRSWCREAYSVLKNLGFDFYIEHFVDFVSTFQDFFKRRKPFKFREPVTAGNRFQTRG